MTDPTGALGDEPSGRHRADGVNGPEPAHDLHHRPGPEPQDGDTWSDLTPERQPVPARGVGLRRSVVAASALVVLGILAAVTFTVRGGPEQLPDPGPSVAIRPPTTPAVIDVVSTGSAGPATGTPTGTRTAPRSTPATSATAPSIAPSSPTTPAPNASTPVWTTRTIQATFVFRRGDTQSTNRTRLTLQSDGDLVIIDESSTVRWRSNTAGTGNIAVFQDDGHFVVYDSTMSPRWQSGTAGRNGAVLVLAADGDVDIVHNGTVVWSSNTAH